MDFYRFWEIIEENYGRFPEPPDSPPEYPSWEEEDLKWSEWEEDGVTLRLVDGHFVDARRKPLPFLDKYVPLVSNWDQTHGISLDYERMYGTLPGGDNPRTGESWDDEDVRVELKGASLSDYGNPRNRIELPDNLLGAIKSHFFKDYK